ncbi:MAG: hypothetical protein ACTSWX_10325 [Promethearchaeota archaeon]
MKNWLKSILATFVILIEIIYYVFFQFYFPKRIIGSSGSMSGPGIEWFIIFLGELTALIVFFLLNRKFKKNNPDIKNHAIYLSGMIGAIFYLLCLYGLFFYIDLIIRIINPAWKGTYESIEEFF